MQFTSLRNWCVSVKKQTNKQASKQDFAEAFPKLVCLNVPVRQLFLNKYARHIQKGLEVFHVYFFLKAHLSSLYNPFWTTGFISQATATVSESESNRNTLCIMLCTKRRQLSFFPLPQATVGSIAGLVLQTLQDFFLFKSVYHYYTGKKFCITSAYIEDFFSFKKIWYDFRVRMTSHVTCSRLISTFKYTFIYI